MLAAVDNTLSDLEITSQGSIRIAAAQTRRLPYSLRQTLTSCDTDNHSVAFDGHGKTQWIKLFSKTFVRQGNSRTHSVLPSMAAKAISWRQAGSRWTRRLDFRFSTKVENG